MIKLWDKLVQFVILTIGKVVWKPNPKTLLTQAELDTIYGMLKENYFVILSHRSNELSTYATAFANLVLTGKWGYWAHALMNLEDSVNQMSDFRLIEAVSAGVKYTPFPQVFDVQGVTLLKPKNMALADWTAVLDVAKTELGKPYDTLFDIANDNALSCVELVRTALMRGDPQYATNFQNFEAMIKKDKNLSPQMYFDCGDFEPVLEIRH